MSMNRIFAAILVLAAAVCVSAQKTPPKATSAIAKLEDGTEVILNLVDSTWNFVRPGLDGATDDVYTTFGDGRILWLKTDYTWAFTKTRPLQTKPKEYPPVNVTSTITHRSLGDASGKANEDAYAKARDNLRKFIIPASAKNGPAFLLACIKDEFKENEIDASYKQVGQQWTATAKISIPNYRVKRIMDCLELQLAPAEEPAKAEPAK